MRNVIRLIGLAMLVPAFVGAGQVFKVGPGGTHATVQEAVTAALAAGSSAEIRVAAGTFVGQIQIASSMKSGSISITGGWDPAFVVQTREPGLTVLDAAGAGRAIYLKPDGGTIALRNLTVTGGRGTEGAGIRFWGPLGASLSILDCRVVGNTATDASAVVGGAGIYITLAGAGTAHIARTWIVGNTGSTPSHLAYGGGALLAAGGTSQLLLEDCVITGNSLTAQSGRSEGAGIYATAEDDASITILGTDVSRNSAVASAEGAAVGTFMSARGKGQLSCSRSSFVGNQGTGNALQTRNVWTTSRGEARVSLADIIVAGGSGRGIEVDLDPAAQMAIANCTVAGNTGSGVVGKATSVFNTIVFGNSSNPPIADEIATGGNLVGIDPLFVNAELFDYRLLPDSPAIDAGVEPPGGLSDVDFSNRSRLVGAKVDIGAHEYQGPGRLAAAALAHTTGYGGTPWRSDLDLANLASKPADVTLRFENANGRITRDVTLAAGETRAWSDVLSTLFGFGVSAKVSGSLRVEDPTSAVVAAVRTYADGGAAGTYGQGYPALGDEAGLVAPAVGILPLVKSNASFYSNVGVLALGSAPVQARVTLVGPSGTTLGNPLTVNADPGRWVQVDDVFAKAGVASADVAYARVESIAAGGRVWGAASVIDRITRDPTTVEAGVPVPTGTVQRLASVAHTSGFGGTAWRSSVAVVNAGATQAQVRLRFRGASTIDKNVLVPAGGVSEWADVLVGLFGLDVASSASGSLEVVADQPVVVACRTYADKGKDGTFGQSYPALTADRGISAGVAGMLPQLRKLATAYTNIGALNLSTVACSATVQLHDAQGQAIGSEQTISTAPGAWTQISDVFEKAGAGQAGEAYAGIMVTTEGCRMWLYASVIDALTRDPTTIELARPFVVKPIL